MLSSQGFITMTTIPATSTTCSTVNVGVEEMAHEECRYHTVRVRKDANDIYT